MRSLKLVILLLIISIKGFCIQEIIPGSPAKGFIENKGQVRDQAGNPNSAVLYTKDFGGMKVHLRKDGFSYELYQVKPKWVDPATIPYKIVTISSGGDTSINWPGQADAMKNKIYHYHRVDVTPEGGNPMTTITPEDKGTSGDRWLLGKNNPQMVEVSKYGQIRYSGVYPGIDMICYANSSTGGFKYDFILHPGADPSLIRLSYSGAESLNLTSEGTLEIKTRFGNLTESIPLCYTENDAGIRTPIEGIHYQLNGNIMRFQGTVTSNDRLVIDPAVNICWGTYYGGSGSDVGNAVKTDSVGFVYMCGITSSPENIATSGSYQDSLLIPEDGFLTKFTNDGQRVWGTYLGGYPAIDINVKNDLVVLANSFLLKFDPSGNLIWGKTVPSGLKALVIDQDENIIAAGDSVYAPPGYVTTHITDTIVKFNSSGVKLWARSYGGAGTEICNVACDDAGNIFVVGRTTDTTGISTSNAHQSEYGGSAVGLVGPNFNQTVVSGNNGDGFIVKFDPAGTVLYGSYYGGSKFDEITDLVVLPNGEFAIAGVSNSMNNIATPGIYQDTLSPNGEVGFLFMIIGGQWECPEGMWQLIDTCISGFYHPKPYDSRVQNTDAFLARFNADGTRIWSTYCGDDYSEDMMHVAYLEKSKNFAISGASTFVALPNDRLATRYAPLTHRWCFNTLFVNSFDSTGHRKWGTYYAGWYSWLRGMDSDRESNVYLCGYANPTPGSTVCNFSGITITTPNGFQQSFGGGFDAFVAKFAASDIDSLILPSPKCVCQGDSATFIIGVLTNPQTDMTFSWSHNGITIPGATDSLLIIPSMSVNDTGYYKYSIIDHDFVWTDSVHLMIRNQPAFNRMEQFPSYYFTNDAGDAGDFDDDGNMDFSLIGSGASNILSSFDSTGYHLQFLFPGIWRGSVKFGDIDNDSKIELLMTGDSTNPGYCTILRKKTGNAIITSFPFQGGFEGSSMDFGDYDNDGDLDLLVTGHPGFLPISVIYKNTGGTFSGSGISFPGVIGCAKFADYDNDHDLDVLITGSSGNNNVIGSTKIFKNTSGIFTEIADTFQQTTYYAYAYTSYCDWGDYDADGNLDFMIAGATNPQWPTYNDSTTMVLYKNLGNGHFIADTNQFISYLSHEIMFGDMDNDGFHDILTSNRFYQNMNGDFVPKSTSYSSAHSGIQGSVRALCDLDKDNDLDVITSNLAFQNDVCNAPNTPPASPNGLVATVSYDTVTISWERATDLQTPQLGLTYNLRVGTTTGGNEILSSMSDSTGWRKVVGMGNAFQNTSWWLHKLPEGRYYSSVQAIDNSFSGGPFSQEVLFDIYEHPAITSQPVSSSVCPGDSIIMGVTATHYFPLSYQWFKNNMAITGATDSVYKKLGADSTDMGQYFCKVSNASFSSYSDTISIDVYYQLHFFLDTVLTPAYTQFADLDGDGELEFSLPDYLNQNYIFGIPGIYDFNNDGLPDVLFYNSDSVRLFINQGNVFTLFQTNISNITNAKVLIGDLDNDGDADLVVIKGGNWWVPGAYVKILINQNLSFQEIILNIPDPYYGDGLLLDYDNDSDLDIYYSGWHYSVMNPAYPTHSFSTILRNDHLQFTSIDLGIQTTIGSSFLGDINSDKRTDLVISGRLDFAGPQFFKTLINDSLSPTGFSQQNLGLPNNQTVWSLGDFDQNGSVDAVVGNYIFYNNNGYFNDSSLAVYGKPGDFDNDGDLDIMSGNMINRNDNCFPPNTPPDAPSGLNVTLGDSVVTFSWYPAADLQTPSPALSYNMRVGSTPGGCQIMTPMSNPSGFRQVVGLGNVQQNTGWWLHNLQPGTYYWSVQAIDNSFAGGPFATEKSFVIPLISLPVPLVNDTFSCGPGVVVLTATGAGPGQTYKWFDDPCSAYSIGSGSPFTTPFLSQSDTFYVAIDSAGFQSIRKKVVVAVFAATIAGEVTGSGTIFFGMGATLKLEGHTGAVLKWQKRWNGGAWLDISETGTSYTEVPDTTGVWDYRAEVRSGICAVLFSDYATVIVQPVSRTINLTLFLEGLFNPATNQMNKARDENGDKYPGTIADVIQVHLAKATTPYSFYYSVYEADLNQDGTCTITVPRAGFYYLAIRHRNSIETWSAAPVSLLTENSSYDFSTAASKAYGDNLIAISGKWVIWGGDVNQDRLIDLGDMIDIDNDVSNFVTGYVVTDVNGDGIVDSDDMLLVIQNSDLFISSVHP